MSEVFHVVCQSHTQPAVSGLWCCSFITPLVSSGQNGIAWDWETETTQAKQSPPCSSAGEAFINWCQAVEHEVELCISFSWGCQGIFEALCFWLVFVTIHISNILKALFDRWIEEQKGILPFQFYLSTAALISQRRYWNNFSVQACVIWFSWCEICSEENNWIEQSPRHVCKSCNCFVFTFDWILSA